MLGATQDYGSGHPRYKFIREKCLARWDVNHGVLSRVLQVVLRMRCYRAPDISSLKNILCTPVVTSVNTMSSSKVNERLIFVSCR